jgi:hypothetical protein
MASEIRVNTINNRSGLGTISINDSGASFSGVVTATSFTGNLTGNVTSSSTSTFTNGLNVTGGSVGIGTDNPLTKFHVNSGTNANFGVTTGAGELSLECFNDVGSANIPLNVRASEYKIKIGGDEKVSITSGGNVQIANGNLVFSTSGTGIDFSATSDGSGTTTSELLDDYEEGTWTPGFGAPGGSAGSAAFSSDGKYVKIGKLVTVYGELYITNKGSWSGTVTFGNLPFTAESGRQNLGACWFTNVSIPTQTFYQSRVGPSESHATMPKISNNGGDAYMQISDITTNSSIRFTVSYTTTS